VRECWNRNLRSWFELDCGRECGVLFEDFVWYGGCFGGVFVWLAGVRCLRLVFLVIRDAGWRFGSQLGYVVMWRFNFDFRVVFDLVVALVWVLFFRVFWYQGWPIIVKRRQSDGLVCDGSNETTMRWRDDVVNDKERQWCRGWW